MSFFLLKIDVLNKYNAILLSQNSLGKYDYFNVVLQFLLSAITRTANDREQGKGLGLVGSPGVRRHRSK